MGRSSATEVSNVRSRRTRGSSGMMFLEDGAKKSTRGWDRLEHPLEKTGEIFRKTGAMCEKHMENIEK